MLESAKEGVTGLSEGSDIGLGCGNRAFESHYSDQQPLKSFSFRCCFLVRIYRAFQKSGFILHSLFNHDIVMMLSVRFADTILQFAFSHPNLNKEFYYGRT